MADELLTYYNRELDAVRRLAREFAAAHPAQAGHLRLGPDTAEDPHVARLIEAFAYLTARIRRKLDDDFPELTESLLEVLYPHTLAPLPAAAIVRFGCVRDLGRSCTVPAGTAIETEEVAGETCRFRTCYPVTLWPITVERATLGGQPLAAPQNRQAEGAAGVLRISLRCLTPEMSFGALKPESLRFFLRGSPQQVWPLYDLIAGGLVSVALAESPTDKEPVILPATAVAPAGFAADEAILPASARTAPGYRLLTEYFAYPEKFLFFDVTGLDAKLRAGGGRQLDIFLYFNRSNTELERTITAENLALGCTPMVNLFPQRADPITLTHRQTAYRVVPDARRQRALEVYGIDRVVATAPDGRAVEYQPFYSGRQARDRARAGAWWHAMRRPAGADDGGTEIQLSLVDLAFDPAAPADHVLSVDTTCLNRSLTDRLPFGGDHPYLSLVEGTPAVARLTCLTAPTRTLRPPAGKETRWRLISHLSLNHLSLLDPDTGRESLREILRLYDFRDSAETRGVIDAVRGLSGRRGAARVPGRIPAVLAQGLDLTLVLDERRFTGTSMLLFAAVLDRFFSLYASINSFTRLSLRAENRREEVKRWPARAGDRILL